MIRATFLDPHRYDAVLFDLEREYVALLDGKPRYDGVDAFPGSVRWVERLRRAGVSTAVVTSSANGDEELRAAGADLVVADLGELA